MYISMKMNVFYYVIRCSLVYTYQYIEDLAAFVATVAGSYQCLSAVRPDVTSIKKWCSKMSAKTTLKS